MVKEKDLDVSKKRVKGLNTDERTYIQQWIKASKTPYYPMPMNYWTSTPDLGKRLRLEDGKKVSYEYYLEDFSGNRIYSEISGKKAAVLGRFEDLDAVDDAVRYLNPNESTVLLVPSALAYGTYGDEKLIPHDFPLIIHLTLLEHEK